MIDSVGTATRVLGKANDVPRRLAQKTFRGPPSDSPSGGSHQPGRGIEHDAATDVQEKPGERTVDVQSLSCGVTVDGCLVFQALELFNPLALQGLVEVVLIIDQKRQVGVEASRPQPIQAAQEVHHLGTHSKVSVRDLVNHQLILLSDLI